jgi:hypothetical protein
MEDKDYLAALRQALDDGRLQIEMDVAKLDHVDSPVFVQAEKSWWVYAALFGGIALGWFVEWHAGVIFAVAVFALYFIVGRRIILTRMRQRLRKVIMEDLALWRKQWRLKGLVLVAGGARCESQDGSWIRFAMAHVAGETPAGSLPPAEGLGA